MIWLAIYLTIGAFFGLISLIKPMDLPWHALLCVAIGVVFLWPLVNVVEIVDVLSQRTFERRQRGEE